MTAAEIVKALGGRNGSARCPAHKDRAPSLSVSEGSDGKLLVHCHAGCSQADVWVALRDRGLVGQTRVRTDPGFQNYRSVNLKSDRQIAALATWEQSVPALHTPAQDYLACRGVVIEPPACIRYHTGKNALVALVQAPDGTFSGIQRVCLATDSRGTWKTGRFSLGPVKAGAVRLTPAAASLQLTESVEDGLALLQMTGKPTWAVPGAGFMESFEPPPEVRELVLAPDHDDAGLAAIEKTSAQLSTPLRKVRQLLPPPELDWCEVLETIEERAGIREFDGGEDRQQAESKSWVEAFCDGN